MGNAYFTIDEGVDKNIATWSRTVDAATVHVQKVAVDEAFMATYTITVFTAVTISSADKHIVQIMAGGTNRVYLRRLRFWQAANATTTQNISLVVYRLTTAGTGGTSYTPVALDPSSSAAGATAMTVPTSKGTEGSLLDQWFPTIHTTATTVGLRPMLDLSWDGLREQSPTIAAGTSNGIAVKCQSSDATATIAWQATICEASY